MKTTKRLVMVFKTDSDNNVSISVDNPKDSLKESEIKSAMEIIIAKDVFAPKEEKLVALVEARIVVTNTNEYELA